MKTENMKKLSMRIQREGNLNDVYYEDVVDPSYGRHHYQVFIKGGKETVASPILDIHFQEGVRFEDDSFCGVTSSDLLEIVRDRLQCIQKRELRKREIACALTHIEEALMWINKDQEDRIERVVLGIHNK